MANEDLNSKLNRLLLNLQKHDKVAVSFSGGVDSAFLAMIAYKVLGDRATAVIINSPTLPKKELLLARGVAKEIGISLYELYVEETTNKDFVLNDIDRCYYCKKLRLEKMINWANDNGINVILEGSNADDAFDYRPGAKALKEFPSVLSPLESFTKNEIRILAKKHGLSVWNKPSMPCLASRIPYGTPIDKTKLNKVEKAEKIVREILKGEYNLRVRYYENFAKIEIDADCLKLIAETQVSNIINEKIKSLGFDFVVLDLAGFKSGCLNISINN